MKLVFALTLMIVSGTAFAEGGDSSENADNSRANYDYSHSAPVYGCRAGQREIVLEQNAENDTLVRVDYVCRNGRFVRVNGAASQPARVTACRNGSTTIIWEQDNLSDTSSPVHYVCRSGRWYRQ